MEIFIATLIANTTNLFIGMAPATLLAHLLYQPDLKALSDPDFTVISLARQQTSFTGMALISQPVQALSLPEFSEIENFVMISAHPPASIIGMDLASHLVILLSPKDLKVEESNIAISLASEPSVITGIRLVLQAVRNL